VKSTFLVAARVARQSSLIFRASAARKLRSTDENEQLQGRDSRKTWLKLRSRTSMRQTFGEERRDTGSSAASAGIDQTVRSRGARTSPSTEFCSVSARAERCEVRLHAVPAMLATCRLGRKYPDREQCARSLHSLTARAHRECWRRQGPAGVLRRAASSVSPGVLSSACGRSAPSAST
jgi:hypothetical protein